MSEMTKSVLVEHEGSESCHTWSHTSLREDSLSKFACTMTTLNNETTGMVEVNYWKEIATTLGKEEAFTLVFTSLARQPTSPVTFFS